MKRAFRKAIAFLSAVAVAATMAVSASAVSASTRIVKDGKYKQVIATEAGLYFTNFSEAEINSKSSNKTVLCVTPDGKKNQVKIKDSADVAWCGSVNTSSVFTYGYSNWIELDYSGFTRTNCVFANGKTLNIKGSRGWANSSTNYNEYIYTKDTNASAFKIYNDKGKTVGSVPYSSLKGVDTYLIESFNLEYYDSDTKTALLCGYDFKSDAMKYWLVRNNKTIKTFVSDSASLVKDKSGSCAVRTYDYDKEVNSRETYYSAKTGKKISNFEEAGYSYTEKKYTVEESGSKYSVKKNGKAIYSIAKKKAAGYYVYNNSVAIVTKSGSKYGLILVK